jgi:hypothetical protein
MRWAAPVAASRTGSGSTMRAGGCATGSGIGVGGRNWPDTSRAWFDWL